MFELAPFALPGDYATGIVSRPDMKAYLAIEDAETEFDDLIDALIGAGVDMVERYCGVYLASRAGVVYTADRLPETCRRGWERFSGLRLPVRPVTAVASFGYRDGSNQAQTWDTGNFTFSSSGVLLPAPGQFWPTDVYASIQIEFTAGYSDANRPAALVQAVKVFVAHLFMNREAVLAVGHLGGEIPLSFRALCDAYRTPVI